jgi:dTDP-4-amino-4,6-dideoxygalactose transaminase
MDKINTPFNKPYLTGKEIDYIQQAIASGHISGNGNFTKKSQLYFEKHWGFNKCLLTTSCTDALEMSAILLDIRPGDEVIMPSFTFVSSALAFVRQGAKIVFVDSLESNPNIDVDQIEKLITPNTKAIVPVHYAGVACEMDKIMAIAEKYNLWVVEDAAQAIDSYYKGKPLGGIGHLGCFSFHETKNLQCGEGGMLSINDDRFASRAEIIWEKGTNRAEFFRGEVDKYGWVDIGSSFLPSEVVAAFLFAQLEELDRIQKIRLSIWNYYYAHLKELENNGCLRFPSVDENATNNGHMFYIILRSLEERAKFIRHLKDNGILSVFHYLSLHNSLYYKDKHDGRDLNNADRFSDCLVRLPLYCELSHNEMEHIISKINLFFKCSSK